MAFTGGITKTVTEKSGNGGKFQQSQNDRLVTVVGYNLANSMVEVVDEDGRKFEVSIPTDVVNENEARVKEKKVVNAAWYGHLIDEKMEKAIPPGKKMILEKFKIVRNVTKNEEKVYIGHANRIINVTCPEPDKTFKGIFTVSVQVKDGVERIGNVQQWAENGVDVNDDAGVESLKTQMREVLADWGTEVHGQRVVKPRMGFQFRAMIPTSEDVFQVVDTSGAFDWIPEEKADGTKTGRPLDEEMFENLLGGYIEYIQEAYPDVIDDMKMEICSYKSFRAGPMSQYMAVPKSEFSPIYQLAHTKTRLSSKEENSVVEGKSWAVNGIIEISEDKAVKTPDKKFEVAPLYYVKRLHANNPKGHVHAWVRSSDGKKCEPHDMLKRIVEKKSENEAGNQKPVPQQNQAQNSAPQKSDYVEDTSSVCGYFYFCCR